MKNKLQTKGFSGGLYTVNVRTGQINEILLLSDYKYNAPEDDALPISGHEWSSDGKSIFFLFHKDRLVKHDLQTGEEKILYKSSDLARGVLQLSPDGKRLLIGLHHPGEEKSHLMTIPAAGGKEKELCASQEAEDFTQAIWSPDGKYIYFTERPEGTNLWRIPAEGGKPQKVWKSEKRAEMFNIHPDGDQIAFSVRERTTEIRVIENLRWEIAETYDKNE
ncbi:MAG: PD40 domain-containing protein [Deltaproteobacteria bacterium]|nr:PD40 domain-containing protein [Deltaproteobacteria bacterium]